MNPRYKIIAHKIGALLAKTYITCIIAGMIFGGIQSCSSKKSSAYYDAISEDGYDVDEYGSARGRS